MEYPHKTIFFIVCGIIAVGCILYLIMRNMAIFKSDKPKLKSYMIDQYPKFKILLTIQLRDVSMDEFNILRRANEKAYGESLIIFDRETNTSIILPNANIIHETSEQRIKKMMPQKVILDKLKKW